MALITTEISVAADFLKSGKLVAIPTETVYGLAGNALNEKAVAAIFEAKKRPFFDPLILHISSIDEVNKYASNFPENAQTACKSFWPGPLTVVLPKAESVSFLCTGGLSSVALRVPNHPLTLALLQSLEFPLAAPSANPFGKTSPTSAQHVEAMLGDRIDCILDGGSCAVGLESSIVSFLDTIPQLLRYGGLEKQKIEEAIGELGIKINNNSNPTAPGQLDKHYAPNAKLTLVTEINSVTIEANPNAFFIYFQQQESQPIASTALSKMGNTEEAAANLFASLHFADAQKPSSIIAELAPELGLGPAINDRLRRAAF